MNVEKIKTESNNSNLYSLVNVSFKEDMNKQSETDFDLRMNKMLTVSSRLKLEVIIN